MNTCKPHNRKFYWVALGSLALSGHLAGAANLVAHWTLDQAASPYADSGPNGIALNQDAGTTVANTGTGLAGAAAQLNWQPTPGVSTRLSASGAALQNNSFGFSFWLNPNWLNPFDNLVGKEMAFDNTAQPWARMAWQVQIGGENTGFAPVEFVVRGDNRANGDWFGNVFSATSLALRSDTPDWIHIAGGYDATSGALNLFVNGLGATSGNSSPNAHSSDGSPFSIGTGRNGNDFVTFAAGAFIDDVQLYDGILSTADVAFLRANPGVAIVPEPGAITLAWLGAMMVLTRAVSRRRG